ncbi:MAG: hypothetical protein F6K52_12650 [Moorea sp. SIO3H5]|nr:hypothetical protein [Moorena sp. SIO3H5]
MKFATGRTSGTQDCFPSCLLPLASCLLPLVSSLLPKNPERKYLTAIAKRCKPY